MKPQIMTSARLFILTSFLLLFSCEDVKHQSQIVGKWRWDDGSTSEYLANGTVVFPDKNLRMSGSWEVEDDLLTIKPTGLAALAGTQVFRIKELSTNHVVLELVSDGKIFRGQRVQYSSN